VIRVPPLQISTFNVRIVGDAELVVHKFSEKTKKEIADKQQKVGTKPRAAKNPAQEYEDARYKLSDGGDGFPAIAFKKAAVSACRNLPYPPMTLARGAFHITGAGGPTGEFVRIVDAKDHACKPHMRTDMVRLPSGTSDIRYRPGYWPWFAELRIRFNTDVLSPDEIVNLINLSGFAVGVGEGRTEKNKDWGFFHVEVV